METADLHNSLEDLSNNIDDLEDSLAPLLNAALSASTSKLPLLDKAKLYVLATYAIESLLFSYLRLNGVEAKSHPVFKELTRVKQYFEKIKAAESAGVKPAVALDKNAAGRFIKHALAGNDRYDRERAEMASQANLGAKRKLEDMTASVGSHHRFAGMSKKMKAEDDRSRETKNNDDHGDKKVQFKTDGEEMEGVEKATQNHGSDEDELTLDEPVAASDVAATKNKKRSPPMSEDKAHEDTADTDYVKSKKPRKKRKSKLEEDASDTSKATETIVPEKARAQKPMRGHDEAFQALLKGPLPKQEEKMSKKHRKSRGKIDSG